MMRATGFGPAQLLTATSVEVLTVVGYGTLAGALVGVAASVVYVPYFQLTRDPSVPVPPFVPRVAWTDIAMIVWAFAVVLGGATAALMYLTLRQHLGQALRLGDQG